MFCSGSRFENVRAGPASYVVFGARKLTSKRSRSGNAVRSQRCVYPSNIELRTSVYPSNFAPIGLKLWENAFQTICNFRFFNSEKKNRRQKKLSKHFFFSRTAVFGRFGLAKVGIGTSVVQNHCLGCDFQVSTMLHRREPSTFVFCSSTLGEKKLHTRGGVQ